MKDIPKKIKIAILVFLMMLPILFQAIWVLSIVCQGNLVIAKVTYSKKHTVHSQDSGDSHYYEIKVSYEADGIIYNDVRLGRYRIGKDVGAPVKIYYKTQNPTVITDGKLLKGTEGAPLILWIAIFAALIWCSIKKE